MEDVICNYVFVTITISIKRYQSAMLQFAFKFNIMAVYVTLIFTRDYATCNDILFTNQ